MIITRARDAHLRRRLVHSAAFFKTKSPDTHDAQIRSNRAVWPSYAARKALSCPFARLERIARRGFLAWWRSQQQNSIWIASLSLAVFQALRACVRGVCLGGCVCVCECVCVVWRVHMICGQAFLQVLSAMSCDFANLLSRSACFSCRKVVGKT